MTTVKERGCVDEIGRALHNREKIDVKNGLIKEEDMKYTLQYLKELKIKYENAKTLLSETVEDKNELIVATVEEMKKHDNEIFKYFLGILDTPITQSMHPAGMVISPLSLPDNYGVIYRNGMQVMQLDMEDVHETGLVKYDILGLKNVQIIKDACELAGVTYPLAHEVDWNDQDVWNDMMKSSIGIFQFESHFAYDSLRKFRPKNISDMSLVTAAIRPSGASYRDKLFNKELGKNPSTIIDDLLKDNYQWLIYQEDIIAFLQQICGLNGSEADNLRRAIARKQKDRMDAALPRVIEGYCDKSNQPREVAEEEVKQYIQIIEDASSYMFGKNHSFAYCMIGYLCAYYRYYYTPQFIVAFLNNAANEDDIKKGFELARVYGYNIEPPRFRFARANYSHGDDKVIYKGLSSVKWLNDAATDYLYTLKFKEFESFVDLLIEIKENANGQIDSRKMEILIKLNFFEEFGGNKKLLSIYEMFNKLYGSKQFNRGRELPISEEWLLSYATRATDKTIFMDGGSKVIIDLVERPENFGRGEKAKWISENTKEVIFYNVECTDTEEPEEPRIVTLLRDYENELPNDFFEIREQMKYDEEFYGYVNMKYDIHANYCNVRNIDVSHSPKVELYSLGTGTSQQYKINKKLFKEKPFKVDQVILILDFKEEAKWLPPVNGKFMKATDGSTELWITDYEVMSNEEFNRVTNGQYGELPTELDYDRILVYDLETGGFSGVTDDILEVGYIVCDRVDNKLVEIERNSFLVKTDKEIKNSHIHNITNNMCNEGISQKECIQNMAKYFNDPTTLVCGYNIIKFDNKFFENYATRITGENFTINNDILDVQPIMKDRLNVQKGFKLEDSIRFYDLDGREDAHRALSDVVDTISVLNAYMAEGRDIDKWIRRGEY